MQWNELHAYAAERGVNIIGDIPMYVSADSADVWANRDEFGVDKKGRVTDEAGVPPDNLCEDGQRWGNPTFKWEKMRANDYAWWTARLARMFELYDFTRLDHFLGFCNYYVVPQGKTPKEGFWRQGPGVDFFEHVGCELGLSELPLIGENLGTITPAVRAMVARTGFPGMDVIQFYDGEPREEYDPAPGCIVYMGTHDTQTLVGWCESRYGLDRASAVEQAGTFIERTLQEQKGVVMLQLQDALLLGDEARMNTPGTIEGNWTWQAAKSE